MLWINLMGYRRKKNFKKTDLIANFMGLPESDETMFLSTPKSITSVIEKAWSDWSIGSQVSPEQVISQNWYKVVGNRLSTKCAPDRIDKSGKLFIRSASGPIKQELSFIKKQIQIRISKLKGCETIKEIKIY